MQVKKFEAQTLQEAIEMVKRELGPDAIILQTKRHRKGLGILTKHTVEVTAAVSDQSLQRKTKLDRKLPTQVKEKVDKLPTPAQVRFYQAAAPMEASAPIDRLASQAKDNVQISKPQRKMTSVPYVDIGEGVAVAPTPRVQPNMDVQVIQAELKQLRSLIESKPTPVPENPWVTQALQEAFDQLLVAGLDRKTSWRFVKDAQFKLGDDASKDAEKVQDALAENLVEVVPVYDPFETIERKHEDNREKPPAVFVFYGATGIGKTTTIAKLASFATQHKHLKIGLINTDQGRVGAFDQLATYAKVLGLPFRSVASTEDLGFAIKDLQVCDLILVDTAGISQRDQTGMENLLELSKALPPHHGHLVLSATTRETELQDIGKRFAKLKPEGLVFTKLDEAIVYGTLFQVPQRLKLPISFFTTGQNVPDDIEKATAERVVALILDIH